MKRILGLDLGTNSIGWAVTEQDFDLKDGKIIKAGSRIIPMSQDVLGKFDSGVSISQTAERTRLRGVRRLRERHLLRRERLHRVLNILGFLPEYYAKEIDFEKHLGQYKQDKEPKLAYRPIDNPNSLKLRKVDFEFVFKDSFEEMVKEFKIAHPDLFEKDKCIPYDWTIYYLRKKALTKKISEHELAWILLNFNQKRGYFQLRGEDEDESTSELIEYHELKVIKVEEDENNKGNTKEDKWYKLTLENGWIYSRKSKTALDNWTNKYKEFIVTTYLNEDGSIKIDKEGKESRSYKSPKEDDWNLVKKRTEDIIKNSNKTVGTYIYENLIKNPNQKINGKLVRTIERKFYKDELINILNTQKEFHQILNDQKILKACGEELYEYNDAHRESLVSRDFTHLFVNDIIFYQRPLKSKKSLISNCKFENRSFLKDGVLTKQPIKCIAKSHPLFQEFRLWQWLQNLRIIEKISEKDVTKDIISTNAKYIDTFKWLNDKAEVDHKGLFAFLLKPLKLNSKNYRWNYVYDEVKDESKKYPCNRTRNKILSKLNNDICKSFLTQENEIRIWEFLYSVQTKEEAEQALIIKQERENKKLNIDQFSLSRLLVDAGFNSEEIASLVKIRLDEKDYGSYSSKAVKKLLSLMRPVDFTSLQQIDEGTKNRIDKIISGEYDETIKNRVRDKSINLKELKDFCGLPLWLSSYIIYDRHSEQGEVRQWKTPDDIQKYLREEFKQHELRNPIVEQVITETLRVVKDIWAHPSLGNSAPKYFDEIHIELGREMKNPADKRKQITNQQNENENTNLRIKALLSEFMNDGAYVNVRPYSPSQLEILKIYEEGVIYANHEIPDDIIKISKQGQPSSSDIKKYKLWLEQGYRSPYTGKIIPLSKLFTAAYQIEHIIPQSRYFDDSFGNKVICEAAVNADKSNLLAYEYIISQGGKMLDNGLKIFTKSEYEEYVKNHYGKNKGKAKRLLMEEIPEEFIQRQLNDSRYISKVVKNLLSNIVREDGETETTSKNLLVVSGGITTQLKKDWGMNDVWNQIIAPRFIRLNEITNSKDYGDYINGHFLPTVPIQHQKGFDKKRIDHRHHAMDAIVIALATRNHINYLNNESGLGKDPQEIKQKRRIDIRSKLCFKKFNVESQGNYQWVFTKPWEDFTKDALDCLESIIVSFKQNLRIINKTVNYHQKWVINDGKPVKTVIKQVKGDNWAIRKPLHKDTVSGLVNLQNLKVPKDKITTATRKVLNTDFNLKTIKSITDTGIQKILRNYLETKGGNPEIAFTPEGIEDMNKYITQYNDGKDHKPILKVRIYEVGSKFQLGYAGNKNKKYVEAAKGTNLFFVIFEDENGKRRFETIPLNEVVENLKHEDTFYGKNNNKIDNKLQTVLSPFDLVEIGENEYYRMVSSTGSQCFFIQNSVAKSIVDKFEFSSLNKMERSINGQMIKEDFKKINIDRLGLIQ